MNQLKLDDLIFRYHDALSMSRAASIRANELMNIADKAFCLICKVKLSWTVGDVVQVGDWGEVLVTVLEGELDENNDPRVDFVAARKLVDSKPDGNNIYFKGSDFKEGAKFIREYENTSR